MTYGMTTSDTCRKAASDLVAERLSGEASVLLPFLAIDKTHIQTFSLVVAPTKNRSPVHFSAVHRSQ